MNINDSEATTIRNISDDSTQIAEGSKNSFDSKITQDQDINSVDSEINQQHHKTIKRVATIAGAGVLLGSASAILMGLKSEADQETPELTEEVDGQVQDPITIAEADDLDVIYNKEPQITDNMTFEEAFATARESLGTGNAFEWRGNIYATYTKDEWEGMSDDEKSVFYESLHIANPYRPSEASENLIAEAVIPEDTVVAQVFENIKPDDDINDIEIVSVSSPSIEEGELEILGVAHDAQTGYGVGSLNVDGQEVFVIDVDGDMVFDALAVDSDGNGVIDENEIIDIRESGLSISDLGGFSDSNIDLFSTGDNTDYLSEMTSGS